MHPRDPSTQSRLPLGTRPALRRGRRTGQRWDYRPVVSMASLASIRLGAWPTPARQLVMDGCIRRSGTGGPTRHDPLRTRGASTTRGGSDARSRC